MKFEDCKTCRFRRRRQDREQPCSDCDVGEFYEDRDSPGVDAVFHEPVTRFGESVTADDSDENEPETEDSPIMEPDDD